MRKPRFCSKLLRGGGTYGVVLKANNQLHPPEPVTGVVISPDLADIKKAAAIPAIGQWLQSFPCSNLHLCRMAGTDTTGLTLLSFSTLQGTPADAQPFLDELDSFKNNLSDSSFFNVSPRTIDLDQGGDLELYSGSR